MEAGRLAVDICKKVLPRDPRKIVDFPSGHGRVMRHFRAHWPAAEIHAVEVDPDALGFCREAFGAHPIQSGAELRAVPLPSNVDLIWSGSLLTHFPKHMWTAFFDLCIAALAPDGVLVFTAHGRIAAMLAGRGDPVFGNLVDVKALYRRYVENEFSYSDYDPKYPVYGLSLASPAWMMRQLQAYPNIKITLFSEGGWGGYQDAIAIQKLPHPIVVGDS